LKIIGEFFSGPMRRLVDIGANLTDRMFRGEYNGKAAVHPDDYAAVLDRAWAAGLHRILITGGSLEDSRAAVELATAHPGLYSTVGVHPTRCNEFRADPAGHLAALQQVVASAPGKVRAIGECGLDYDRLEFCDKATQLEFFGAQFELAKATDLPMFLHNRNTGGDFARVMRSHRPHLKGGVAHSFTGDAQELRDLLALDLYIGINGCSLKTEENLQVMAQVPLDRLLLETDAPWCDIRPTHAGHRYVQTPADGRKRERFEAGRQIKGRNEPCNLVQVLEVVAGYRPDVPDAAALAAAVHANALRLFWPEDLDPPPEGAGPVPPP